MSDCSKYCKKCNILCPINNFYKSKNKSYIDGRIDWCKKCMSYYKQKDKKDDMNVYRIEHKEITFHFD